jgi:hypothetical protein
MNKFFTGFAPASNIRIPLMICAGIYIIFLFGELKSNMYMQRSVPLESRQEGGIVILNGVKHAVPYQIEKTLIRFDIDNFADFLLLANGAENESFTTLILQLVVCVMIEILLWKLNFSDPFNSRQLKSFIWVCNLLILVFVAELCKNTYTISWVRNSAQGLGRYQFVSGFNVFYYIILVWIVRMIVSFYRKGVKTHQELEFVI